MGIIETNNSEVRALKGLHLYHAAISNCSQKVRFCLDEKGLDWHSHEVNLRQSEHLKADFLSINPRGLVPVLVHDGAVIIESSDIILYIETAFPAPPLTPQTPEDRSLAERWLSLWDETQPHIKTLTHAGRIGGFRRAAGRLPIELAMARDNGLQNPELIAFLAELASIEGLAPEKIADAMAAAQDRLRSLEDRLAGHDWLAGPSFSLADLAWSIDIHRFQFLAMSLDAYPSVRRWYEAIRRRPSFERMVTAYELAALQAMSAAPAP
jgi:glutathione S-transferase